MAVNHITMPPTKLQAALLLSYSQSFQREMAKMALLEQLSTGKTFGEVSENLQTLENSKTIAERIQ